jgi:hypothetical protein
VRKEGGQCRLYSTRGSSCDFVSIISGVSHCGGNQDRRRNRQHRLGESEAGFGPRDFLGFLPRKRRGSLSVVKPWDGSIGGNEQGVGGMTGRRTRSALREACSVESEHDFADGVSGYDDPI